MRESGIMASAFVMWNPKIYLLVAEDNRD